MSAGIMSEEEINSIGNTRFILIKGSVSKF